jgi:trimeric autotransporter adhesin
MICARVCFAIIIVSCVPVVNAQDLTGSGTPNYLPLWTTTSKLGSSAVYQSSTEKIGIGTNNPTAKLAVVTVAPSGEAITGTNDSDSSDTFPVGIAGLSAGPLGVGVYGSATNTKGTGVGVFGVTVSPTGTGIEGVSDATTGGGENTSGVEGVFNATTGNGNGVIGFTYTPEGAGVSGNAKATISTANADGVLGTSTAPKGAGVAGTSTVNIGVSGITNGASGEGGYFDNTVAGNILIGAVSGVHKFRVDGTGKGYFDGGTQTGGADFAESVAVAPGANEQTPGDLLVVDPSGKRQLKLATEPYSTLVAGIYSTKPGVLATPHSMNETVTNEVPLAIVGIVPCKVSAENGPIVPGDLLVSSSTPGHAMKGSDRSRMLGAVVGKALEPLSAGTGVIQVLVTLQ